MSTTGTSDNLDPIPRGQLVAACVFAVLAALFWGVLFFGLIDLSVVPMSMTDFAPHYLLETGWGLLYTMLVMLPLLLWAVRPRCDVLIQQVLAAAAAVAVTGVAAAAGGQVVAAAFLALTALAPPAMAGRRFRPELPRALPRRSVPLAALAVLAVPAATWYAVDMLHAAYTGALDDNTWGLMHLPMQAGFGLALAGAAAVAVLAHLNDASGWRISALPAAISAAWLGIVSYLYPTTLGSLGTVGGAAAVCWAVAFTLTTFATPRVARRPISDVSSLHMTRGPASR